MGDFAAALERVQNKNGRCLLRNEHYSPIRAQRIHHTTKEVKFYNCYWRLMNANNDLPVIEFLGGVTGWEAYEINDYLVQNVKPFNSFTFCTCAGTPGRYDQLWLNELDVYNVIHTILGAQ